MSIPDGIPAVAPRGLAARPEIRWIDPLHDPAAWSAGPGTVVSLAGHGFLGGGSAALAVAAGGSGCIARTTGAVDLCASSLVVAFRHDSPAHCAALTLEAASAPGDRFVWRIPADRLGRSPGFLAGEWAVVGLSFADADVAGAPNRAALTDWQFTAAAADGPITVELGGLGSAPLPSAYPNGVISLTFDDCFDTQYSIAYPAMAAHGLRGTLVPIVGRLDQPDYLTSTQVDHLATAGWEICGHAMSDETHSAKLHLMTPQQRFAELAQIREWNAARGYSTDTFAYPGGWYDAQSARDALRFFAAARSANGSLVETWPTTQIDRIRTVVVRAETHPTLAEFQAHIDQARDHQAWIVFTFHSFAESMERGPYDILGDVFRGFCAALASSGVAVLPMREALAGRAIY